MKYAALLVVVAFFCAGCPDPQEVGAIPHQQVDDARVRVKAAEKKIEKNDAAAAAITDQ